MSLLISVCRSFLGLLLLILFLILVIGHIFLPFPITNNMLSYADIQHCKFGFVFISRMLHFVQMGRWFKWITLSLSRLVWGFVKVGVEQPLLWGTQSHLMRCAVSGCPGCLFIRVQFWVWHNFQNLHLAPSQPAAVLC